MNAKIKAALPIVLVCLLVALGVVAAFWALERMDETASERRGIRTVIDGGRVVLSDLKDAETGERGFSLTGNEAFLEPYLAVRDSVRGRVDALRGLVASPAARKHLDAMVPLVDAKMAELAQVIALQRSNEVGRAKALIASGEGKRLMDALRVEVAAFVALEETEFARIETELRALMRGLFLIITGASVLALCFALMFALATHRQAQQRVKDLLNLETQKLLAVQTASNERLQQVVETLQMSEERLAVTLNSIGDAVIATSANGRVTLLNPRAERLTGWRQAE